MKKGLFLVVAILLGMLGASNATAQTSKGNFVIAGASSLSVVNSRVEKVGESTTNFNLTSSFGYFVINNLSVGLSAALSSQSGATTYAILPTVDYYFNSGNRFIPKVSMGVGYAGTSMNEERVGGLAVAAGLGGVYMVASNVGLSLGVAYNRNMYKYQGISINQNNFAGVLGFEIFF